VLRAGIPKETLSPGGEGEVLQPCRSRQFDGSGGFGIEVKLSRTRVLARGEKRFSDACWPGKPS
jgi:hypothetical protein